MTDEMGQTSEHVSSPPLMKMSRSSRGMYIECLHKEQDDIKEVVSILNRDPLEGRYNRAWFCENSAFVYLFSLNYA